MQSFPVLMHTALDATNCRELAEFYRQFLGLQYRQGDEIPGDGNDDSDWLVLVNSAGERVLACNEVAALSRATWPADDVSKQLHMDFRVPNRDELERQRGRAEELGATFVYDRSAHEEPLYVLADPAGHPFCILVSAG